MTLRVEGLWRYPVKSLAGEALEAAELTADGIPSDRIMGLLNNRAVIARFVILHLVHSALPVYYPGAGYVSTGNR